MSKDKKLPISDGWYLKVTVVHSDNTTIATMVHEPSSPWGEDVLLGIGVARRHPGDKRNQKVGETLALTRMFQSAIDAMEPDLKVRGLTARQHARERITEVEISQKK